MRVSLNYHEILEETLIEKLEWLKEEFKIIFAPKTGRFTSKDKKIANDIINYILEHTYVYNNIIMFNLLNETTESIEKMYPNLF